MVCFDGQNPAPAETYMEMHSDQLGQGEIKPETLKRVICREAAGEEEVLCGFSSR